MRLEILLEIASKRLTPEVLTQTIREVGQEFIDKGMVKCLYDIGSGHCYNFVRAVFDRLESYGTNYNWEKGPIRIVRTEDFWKDDFLASVRLLKRAGEQVPIDIPREEFEDLIGSATHEWMKFGRLYYDAEASEGVERFLDLPFFKRQIEGLRKKLAKKGKRKQIREMEIIDNRDGIGTTYINPVQLPKMLKNAGFANDGAGAILHGKYFVVSFASGVDHVWISNEAGLPHVDWDIPVNFNKHTLRMIVTTREVIVEFWIDLEEFDAEGNEITGYDPNNPPIPKAEMDRIIQHVQSHPAIRGAYRQTPPKISIRVMDSVTGQVFEYDGKQARVGEM